MTGRRSDGYHLLDSLVGFCEFGDRLEISLNEARDEIITEGTFGGEIGDNNIIRKTKLIITENFKKCFSASIILFSPYLFTKKVKLINLKPLESKEHNKKIIKL